MATFMESFAGPHDMANSGLWYDLEKGQIKMSLSFFEKQFGEYGLNYTTSLIFATPFAVAGMIPDSVAMTLNTRNVRQR